MTALNNSPAVSKLKRTPSHALGSQKRVKQVELGLSQAGGGWEGGSYA